MASTPTTRWQVNGYRFLVRRMEHALVRRDVRMLHDPMKSQSRALVVGIVVASLGLAACGALAIFRPQDKIGNATIVVGKDSGAMYVAYEDTFRPVLNLASARLILGKADDPVTVKESEIADRPRASLVGIPGAPQTLANGEQAAWSVCDTVSGDGNRSVTTSVLVGDRVIGEGGARLDGGQALLVGTRDESYLVYDGKRARIDMSNPRVTRALELEGIAPRPVSRGLLNAVPEVAEIRAPYIPHAGSATDYDLGGKPVGSVVRVKGQDDDSWTHYVLLQDGIQEISGAVARLIMYSNPTSDATEVDSVNPAAIGGVASTRSPIAVDTFPRDSPEVIGTQDKLVSCLTWSMLEGSTAENPQGSELSLFAGRSLPISPDARTVKLAQADGSGDNADHVYVQPGRAGFVQSTGIEAGSTRRDSRFYVADTGVRFGIADATHEADSAKALGLDGVPALAPWQILGLLAPGPQLDRESALIAHDGVAPAPDPAGISLK
ncbi:type VII secretion protein EccB [Rhodococcus triatomae]|uniref:Type VII secretion protein EccB n=1 Tax=Rhodococcus triatomae TaxID=300028 RepID=A0A1G8R8B7_9NOCA|nr:type VII secretion protein EccB [Rhodococcus triatomae]QNG19594.1 type VII secretion protein EccB [Rhodococcus triatomae]QNG24491.1 type VII secretion protein EccB [Rhodococcus triatomae]SDJ12765.1 type VII secretion protein EccB [Rhodococcus triatomae]